MKECVLTIDNQVWEKSYIADKFWDQLIGLMFKKDISEECAVVFPKCNSLHTMNMFFSLDIIYIDENSNILKICRNIKPWKITKGPKGTRTAIEMKAGTLNKNSEPKAVIIKDVKTGEIFKI